MGEKAEYAGGNQWPGRKIRFSLIAVYKDGRLVNVDSQSPNQTVYEALSSGAVREIGRVEHVKTEVVYGNSRFDLYFEAGGQKALLEVKGVTLERDGVAMFPDAPTARGTRHIYEMAEAVANGYAGYLLFLVQMRSVIRYDARLDTLFLATPISWKGTLQQYAGRLHRLYEGKREVQIYDYVDIQVPLCMRK